MLGALKRWAGLAVCKLPKQLGGGHKRGKLVGQATASNGPSFNDYQCPRCEAKWTRKQRNAKAATLKAVA